MIDLQDVSVVHNDNQEVSRKENNKYNKNCDILKTLKKIVLIVFIVFS